MLIFVYPDCQYIEMYWILGFRPCILQLCYMYLLPLRRTFLFESLGFLRKQVCSLQLGSFISFPVCLSFFPLALLKWPQNFQHVLNRVRATSLTCSQSQGLHIQSFTSKKDITQRLRLRQFYISPVLLRVFITKRCWVLSTTFCFS